MQRTSLFSSIVLFTRGRRQAGNKSAFNTGQGLERCMNILSGNFSTTWRRHLHEWLALRIFCSINIDKDIFTFARTDRRCDQQV